MGVGDPGMWHGQQWLWVGWTGILLHSFICTQRTYYISMLEELKKKDNFKHVKEERNTSHDSLTFLIFSNIIDIWTL